MGRDDTGRISLEGYLRRLDIFERWKRRKDLPRDLPRLLELATSGVNQDGLPIDVNLDVNREDK